MNMYFNALPGPTYHHGGLSIGNNASIANKGSISNPKKCALEVLDLMHFVATHTDNQFIFPLNYRPLNEVIKNYPVLQDVEDDYILSMLFSGSYIWLNNSATFTPKRLSSYNYSSLTVANLVSKFHRGQDAEYYYYHYLKCLPKLMIHRPLPSSLTFSDEGAANCLITNNAMIFVYGMDNTSTITTDVIPRQNLIASQVIRKSHGVLENKSYLVKQNPSVINKGCFHNDILGFVVKGTLVFHEDAYLELKDFIKFLELNSIDYIRVTNTELSVEESVSSYFFNSYPVITKSGETLLICCTEVKNNPKSLNLLKKIAKDLDIDYHFVNVVESMRNGGGPACLRMELDLPQEELTYNNNYKFDNKKYQLIRDFVEKYYPDSIQIKDFRSKAFLQNIQDIYKHLGEIFL